VVREIVEKLREDFVRVMMSMKTTEKRKKEILKCP
jgi:hypothetical protein